MSLSPKRHKSNQAVQPSPTPAKSAKEHPRLIVISAPSGAGKTTLCEMLLKEVPQLKRSVSATTRARRPDEVDGVHYFFIERKEFEAKIRRGDFIEYAEVHGQLYGTPKDRIEEWLGEGRPVVFNIDVQGAMALQKNYPQRVLLIFIHAPSMEVLEERLKKRQGDSPTSIEKRLKNAYNEIEWSKSFDYQIVNDELSKAFGKLKEIVKKECR